MIEMCSNTVFTRTAHAKINLALHITGQRDDGYHLLDSLVCFTEAGDRLEIALAHDPRQLVNLDLAGPFAFKLGALDLGQPQNNLITRAARALAARLGDLGICCSPVRITLEKNLPVASGVGGGSADAAAVLVLLAKIWACDSHINLHDIAVNLGADVAMCLGDQPKRVQGIGERISAFRLTCPLPLLLVNPDISISTPQVFGVLEEKHQPPIGMENGLDYPGNLVSIKDVVDFIAPLRNDLQSPAMSLVPEISNVLAQISKQPGCLLTRMSGSGATCFGIFDCETRAGEAMTQIKDKHSHWWSVASNTIPKRAS